MRTESYTAEAIQQAIAHGPITEAYHSMIEFFVLDGLSN